MNFPSYLSHQHITYYQSMWDDFIWYFPQQMSHSFDNQHVCKNKTNGFFLWPSGENKFQTKKKSDLSVAYHYVERNRTPMLRRCEWKLPIFRHLWNVTQNFTFVHNYFPFPLLNHFRTEAISSFIRLPLQPRKKDTNIYLRFFFIFIFVFYFSIQKRADKLIRLFIYQALIVSHPSRLLSFEHHDKNHFDRKFWRKFTSNINSSFEIITKVIA